MKKWIQNWQRKMRMILLLVAYLLLGTAQSSITFFDLIHREALSKQATYWEAIKINLHYTFKGYSKYIYKYYLSIADVFFDYLFFLCLFSFLIFILRKRRWIGTLVITIFSAVSMLYVNLSIFGDLVASWSTYSFSEAFQETLDYGVTNLFIATVVIAVIDIWYRRGRLDNR